MQPLFAALGACAQGESRIVDLRFAGRYAYLEEFAKMGVESFIRGGTAHIHGTQSLRGSSVVALDLRAGAALALLGLRAEGETQIADAWQIERGYDRFLGKAQALNANMAYFDR
jgi:UDP-N-acetylglucosamine 1-carboxyvinyltransferase